MNIRVILVLLAIILFAGVFGALNFMSIQELNLEQAYVAGTIRIVQKTGSGNVPHELSLFNTGDKPIKIERGYTLTSKSTADMVITREEIVAAGNNVTILAYSIEPDVNAKPGIEMAVSQKAPQLILDLITNSNPQNPAEAFKTQLKIWILLSDGEVDLYKGEVQSLRLEKGIYASQLQNNISVAKIELMTQFNLTEEDLANMSTNIDQIRPEDNWWNQLLNLIS